MKIRRNNHYRDCLWHKSEYSLYCLGLCLLIMEGQPTGFCYLRTGVSFLNSDAVPFHKPICEVDFLCHFLEEYIFMNEKLTREQCLELLKQKFIQLGRLPKRSDFSDYQVMMIKSFFGPWPRALEVAGVKPPRNDDILEKRHLKRIRTKIRKREFKSQNNA